jgi:pSer/pThr/pTyr-binding forkhead associated (FHA) protein
MLAKLICLDAIAPVGEVPLDSLPLTFGRSVDADIRLDDGWVSRYHCEIDQRDGLLVVRDLNSSHGTLVNGSPIEEATLQPGDRLSIGISTFVVAYRGIPSGRRNVQPLQAAGSHAADR